MITRIRLLTISLISVFLVISARLFYWQVVKGPLLAKEAKNQQTSGVSIYAPRGDIYASDNSYLSASTNSFVAFAYLPDISSPKEEIASALTPIFTNLEITRLKEKKAQLEEQKKYQQKEESPSENEEESEESPEELSSSKKEAKEIEIDENKIKKEINLSMLNALSKTDTTWVALRRKVPPTAKEEIEKFRFKGIGFDKETTRFYPEEQMAAHILGFVGKDESGQDKGYFGLEGYYDLTLKGKKGYLQRESNALGIPILIGKSTSADAQSGVNLTTHIDKYIQLKVENKLKEALEKYDAKSATAIVIDPKDGGVLAMASYPTFSPKTFYDYTNEVFLNPAISESFEPGSVFKPIIMAAALNEKKVEPDTKCDICGQPLKVDKYYIKTWNNEYEEGRTMTDVIVHSDNVGMAFAADRLGAKKMHQYLESFGIGKLTGIDLQGEMTPPLKEKLTYVDVATISFGQGLATTPIQLISAITTIARDGIPITPQVVDKLALDDWEKDIKPKEGKRVISPKTAEEITQMMIKAAEKGEAQWTALRDFQIAGKTGTAQIPVEGHYDEEKTIASFVGFAPANDPAFVMLVTLKEPQSSPWASETAAPLWFDIAKDLFSHFSIQPKK